MLRLCLAENSLHNYELLFLIRLVRVILYETFLVLALAVSEKKAPQLNLLSLVIVWRDLIEPEADNLRIFLLELGVRHILGRDETEFFFHFVALTSLDEATFLIFAAAVIVVPSITSIVVLLAEFGTHTVAGGPPVVTSLVVVVAGTSVLVLFFYIAALLEGDLWQLIQALGNAGLSLCYAVSNRDNLEQINFAGDHEFGKFAQIILTDLVSGTSLDLLECLVKLFG